MNNIYRFTGNPENWITAISRETWALNENNKNVWDKLQPGDTILFHSTAKTEFKLDAPSSVIGFGYVGEGKYMKEDYWWVQEVREQKNMWSLFQRYIFIQTQVV